MKTTERWGIRTFRAFMALCVLGMCWLLWLALREGNLVLASMHGGVILVGVSTVFLPTQLFVDPALPSLSQRLKMPAANQWLIFAGLGLFVVAAILKATSNVPSN